MKTININSVLAVPIPIKQNNEKKQSSSISEIKEGGRHHELYKFIASLRDKGTTHVQALEIALAFNKAKCQPPLSETEIEKSVRDVYTYAKGKYPQPTSNKTLETISSYDLDHENIPSLLWLVENTLPQGIGILSSQPKGKKSFFCLDLGLSISAGVPFLGRNVTKGDVLILALEDSRIRMQERARKIWSDIKPNAELPKELRYAFTAERINDGLMEQLNNFITEFPNTKLIIIDILEMIKGGIGRNESEYSYNSRELKMLGEFANTHNICVLVVHHDRKNIDKDNPFSNILGSTALQGAVDTMFVLLKETNVKSTLYFKGRDVYEQSLSIEFDETALRWRCIGSAADEAKRIALAEYQSCPVVRYIKRRLADKDKLAITDNFLKLTAKEIQSEVLKDYGFISEIETTGGIGRYLRKLKPQLEADNIFYRPPNPNGANGKRIHTFADLTPPTENIDTCDTIDTDILANFTNEVSVVAEVSINNEETNNE